MRKLQVAFSRKEKVERLLSNLENLKNEGSIEQSQYQALKDNYSRLLSDCTAEIRNIKTNLEAEVQQEEYRAGAYAQELTNLEARFRVGELTADQHIKMRESAQGKLEKARRKIEELKRLIAAESASQIGGYLDVPIEKKATESVFSGLSDTKAGELFQNLLNSGIGRILAIVAVVLMVLGCIIPWTSFLGLSVSPIEVGKSGWMGAALLLLTAGCLGLLFLGSAAKRGLGISSVAL
jgi:ElaB/YqjD/DUF883 family membrane-anchored ribosome-binding protein